ncbi:hypothetical protein ABBQ32_008434 [Trebouxia sp. C0010 RCD-2024]
MADYHSTYKGPEGQTTQWDDIQRKMGNLPAKEPVNQADPFTPEKEETKNKEWVDSKAVEELAELDDEFDDDRFLEQYRQERIQQLKQAQNKAKFGTVEQITRGDFVQQVTNAGEDVYVVVLLYKDKVAESAMLEECLTELAKKYPQSKFVKIISTECIPNYPDKNVPTVLIYKDTQCLQHLIGLAPFGGPRTTPEQVALALNRFGPICRREGEEDTPLSMQDIRELIKSLLIQQSDKVKDSTQEDDLDN